MPQSDERRIPISLPEAPWRSRLRAWWSDHRWPVIALFWLIALALSFTGYMAYQPGEQDPIPPMNALYRAVQLFVLEGDFAPEAMPWQLQAGRFLAPLVAALTAIETLALLFAEQVDRLRPRFARDHAVICGLGERGLRLACGLRAQGRRVVVIESDRDNVNVALAREHGITVLIADASQEHSLRRAGIMKAAWVVAVCGGDGTNAEIAARARSVAHERDSGTLACVMHVGDLELCRLLRDRTIATERSDAFRLEFFNIFETGARAILDAHPLMVVAQRGRSDGHILLVGLGKLGESILLTSARRWRRSHRGDCLRITVIDPEATERLASVRARYPILDSECELIPIDAGTEASALLRRDILAEAAADGEPTIAYVCLPDDAESLSAALALYRQLPRGTPPMPIVVRTREGAGLPALLSCVEDPGTAGGNLHAFGLLDETCRPEVLMQSIHQRIAQAIHADYLRHAVAGGEKLRSRPSLCPWEELSEDYREANRAQADHIATRLHAFGYRIVPLTDPEAECFQFSPEEIEGMARMEHERWCQERRENGWEYGEERDDDEKLHPDLVPWDRLSEPSREKDRQFARDLPIFLAEVGFQVEPEDAAENAESG